MQKDLEIKERDLHLQRLEKEISEKCLNGCPASSSLELQLAEQLERFKLLESDHEDLLMFMEEQDQEIKGLKIRLKSHGEIIETEDDNSEDGL